MKKLSKINKGVKMGPIQIQLPKEDPLHLEVVAQNQKGKIPLHKFWNVAGKILREMLSPGAPLDATPVILDKHGINLIIIDELKKVESLNVNQRNEAFSACKKAINRMDVTPQPFLISDVELNEILEE